MSISVASTLRTDTESWLQAQWPFRLTLAPPAAGEDVRRALAPSTYIPTAPRPIGCSEEGDVAPPVADGPSSLGEQPGAVATCPGAPDRSPRHSTDKAECLCVICQDGPATLTLMCCGQHVHARCQAKWLDRSDTCPHCRALQHAEPEPNDDQDPRTPTDSDAWDEALFGPDAYDYNDLDHDDEEEEEGDSSTGGDGDDTDAGPYVDDDEGYTDVGDDTYDDGNTPGYYFYPMPPPPPPRFVIAGAAGSAEHPGVLPSFPNDHPHAPPSYAETVARVAARRYRHEPYGWW